MTDDRRLRVPYFAIDLTSSVVSRLVPSGMRPTVEQLRRDARRFVERISGQATPSFVHREPAPDAYAPLVTDEADAARTTPATTTPPASTTATPAYVDPLSPRPLHVTEVIAETADAVTLRLLDPEDRPFALVAGQFFTVCVDVNGEHLRRAYSISSLAGRQETADITIKRVAGGRVSTHLTQRIVPGDRIFVLGPSGSFTITPDHTRARRLVLIGGGSGITPLLSMMRTLLPAEPQTLIALLYGNRAPADIIFAKAIAELAAQYPDRLFVRHTLEQPPENWDGGTGFLDGKELLRQLTTLPAWPADEIEYYSCGPEPMMAACKAALLEQQGVHPSHLHEERFVNPEARIDAADAATESLPVKLKLAGKMHEFTVAPGQSVLEAGLKAGLQMPFSCAMGGCAECMMKLTSGQLQMAEPNCLTPEEREDGYVLTCVGRPKTALGLER